MTVIVDSPIKTGAVDELQRRTGLKIELALASAAKIRELVRQVYAKADPASDQIETHPPLDVPALVSAAVERGSPSFGISVRGQRVTGWFQERAAVRRRFLLPAWGEELERDLLPRPSEKIAGKDRAEWTAHIARKGMSLPVEVRYAGGPAGSEYVFRLVEERTKIHERFPPPNPGMLSEVKLLVRSGAARFAVATEPPELLDEILPHLPVLLLDPYWRSAHLSSPSRAAADEDAFRLAIPNDPEGRRKALDGVRGFRFDAVTAALDGPLGTWADAVLDAAGVVFLPLRPGDLKAAEKAGVRWELRARREAGGRLDWTLQPLGN